MRYQKHLDSIAPPREWPVCDSPRHSSLPRGLEKWAWPARELPRHHLVRHMVEIPASLVSRSCSSCAGVAVAMSSRVLLWDDRPKMLAWPTLADRTSTYSNPFVATSQLLIHLFTVPWSYWDAWHLWTEHSRLSLPVMPCAPASSAQICCFSVTLLVVLWTLWPHMRYNLIFRTYKMYLRPF